MLARAAVVVLLFPGRIQMDGVVTHPHAKITQHDVMRFHVDAEVAQHYSRAGSLLSVNGDEWFSNAESRFERDDSADLEINDTRTRRVHRGAQATGAGIIKVRNGDDFPTAASRRVSPETFGTGEGNFISARREGRIHRVI